MIREGGTEGKSVDTPVTEPVGTCRVSWRGRSVGSGRETTRTLGKFGSRVVDTYLLLLGVTLYLRTIRESRSFCVGIGGGYGFLVNGYVFSSLLLFKTSPLPRPQSRFP